MRSRAWEGCRESQRSYLGRPAIKPKGNSACESRLRRQESGTGRKKIRDGLNKERISTVSSLRNEQGRQKLSDRETDGQRQLELSLTGQALYGGWEEVPFPKNSLWYRVSSSMAFWQRPTQSRLLGFLQIFPHRAVGNLTDPGDGLVGKPLIF